ncbi:hypothetical protein BABINDRAFT_83101 [Babjeviella inositovora NRRL Y-12698]|uniref:Uncharacterized protein n=1 Tax=Babjeviella inositovora NRRL Y-12698 TaxID=984486 RepID=A0A1E3QL11_9ASCO|nr:uncharacterized protein BABINDRAFT_83101 [Babjeviella inositovora NRRL Y-12698]ODQ78371.1 hypothetical protein BABINDRAFT_83101 [Babjeviella inositovora NRRL Y-12698]
MTPLEQAGSVASPTNLKLGHRTLSFWIRVFPYNCDLCGYYMRWHLHPAYLLRRLGCLRWLSKESFAAKRHLFTDSRCAGCVILPISHLQTVGELLPRSNLQRVRVK